MQLENILISGLKKDSFYWHQDGYKSPIRNWDDLAKVNAIYAAVSSQDEKGEGEKSKADIEMIKNKLNDGVVLDLGCGYGRLAKYLLPIRKFSGYIGVDSSVNMLDIFFKRYQERSLEQATPLMLINSDIDKILVKDGSVDNVIVSAVFLHNHKTITVRAINEIYRILKPNGKLFVIGSFPNNFSLAGLQGEIYNFILKILGRGYKNGPVRYFSKKEIENKLNKFNKREVYFVCFTFFTKSIIIFPKFLNKIYRKAFFDPVDKFLLLVLPEKIKKLFCTHFDVVAYK